MMTAYMLWFLLAGLGAHRFYLKRAMSGLFLALMNFFGIAASLLGVMQNMPEYLMIGGTTLLAVAAWWLLDAFFIPGMVRQLNDTDRPRSFVSLGAVNMDPSFSATMAGADVPREAGSKKANLPEDFEMPWRKKQEKPTVVRYRSDD